MGLAAKSIAISGHEKSVEYINEISELIYDDVGEELLEEAKQLLSANK